TVTDDKGRVLPNPYAEPPEAGASHGTFSKNALEPGKEVVIKRALNQCVHIDKPGTYTITAEFGVHRGTEGWGKDEDWRQCKALPAKVAVRAGDRGKRDRAIDELVRAYRTDGSMPQGQEPGDVQFSGRLDILRRLVFYNEPRLLPLFLDVLDRKSASSMD